MEGTMDHQHSREPTPLGCSCGRTHGFSLRAWEAWDHLPEPKKHLQSCVGLKIPRLH